MNQRLMNVVKGLGLPVIDHSDLDSFDLPTLGKSKRYLQMLHDLPAGLSEWAIHPCKGNRRSYGRSIPAGAFAMLIILSSIQTNAGEPLQMPGLRLLIIDLLQPFWKK